LSKPVQYFQRNQIQRRKTSHRRRAERAKKRAEQNVKEEVKAEAAKKRPERLSRYTAGKLAASELLLVFRPELLPHNRGKARVRLFCVNKLVNDKKQKAADAVDEGATGTVEEGSPMVLRWRQRHRVLSRVLPR